MSEHKKKEEKTQLNIPSIEFKEGFTISFYKNGIIIEAVDYHPVPLFLDEKKLKSIGLHLDRKKTRKLRDYIRNNKK